MNRLTREQKEYRFIAAAKGKIGKTDAEGYLSDAIPIYTASATKLRMIDFPLGGDVSPYEINGTTVTWNPKFEGNLLFAYTNPEPITLTNTILGGELDLTTDYDYSSDSGYVYNNGSESKINGYLGSYAGNSVFSLVIREQTDDESMANLISGGNSDFTTVFDSVTVGGKGTFPTPNGLLHIASGEPSALDFNSATATSGRMRSGGGGDVPDGFEVEMGINLPQISFENFLGFDGIGFQMEGNRIGFTVGTPIAGHSFTDPSKPATDTLKDNWNLADKLGQGSEIFEQSDDNWLEDDGTGAITSKEAGVSFSVSAAFFWEYDPVQDTFLFAEAAISAKGAFEFSLQHRFAFCPLVYIYVKTGIGVGVGTGLGREYVETEVAETTPLFKTYSGNTLSDELGDTVSLKATGTPGANSVVYFETDAKALNIYYSGELLVEFLNNAGQTIRKGTIASENRAAPEKINIDKTVKKLAPQASYIVRVTALKDSTITRIKGVSDYNDIVYFKGFTISPDLFLEVGAGVGIDILKAEVYIKVTVEAAFTFGGYVGYYNNEPHYEGARVESFDFSASVGVRAVFLLFTFELTGAGYEIHYKDGEWKRGWTFWNEYGSENENGRSMRRSTVNESAIKAPQSAADSQQLFRAVVSEYQVMAARLGTGVPFELSSYSTDASANALAEEMSLGYDHQLVTAGDRNFLVYTISRAKEDVDNDIDASLLVLSELVEGADGYGLVNPLGAGETECYIPVDDDGTGDTDFDVYTDGANIYVTWLNYKTVSAEGATVTLSDAVSNVELRRTVFDIDDGTFAASETIGTEIAATSSTLDKAVAYVVPTLYTEAEYDTAYGEYVTYVDASYNFGSDVEAAKKMKELMTATWAMRAQTEGKASTIKFAYYEESGVPGWNYATITLPAGYRVTGLDMVQLGAEYLLSYLAECNTYEGGEYVTYKRLYLAKVAVTAGNPVASTYTLKTIVDYDLTTENDGEVVAGPTTKPIANPIIGYPRFVEGKLTNGGSVEPLLLYDYCGNTVMIDSEGIVNIIAGTPFAENRLFGTAEGEDAGKVEANIGVDGDGNVSVVYVSTVRGTSNNAIFVSKYDPDLGTFGEGQILAMNNLGVYEDSFRDVGRDWDEKALEKAYYGDLEGYDSGSPTDLAFSNLQVAYGKQKAGGESGSLLIIASGSKSDLVEAPDGARHVASGSTKTGFYALNFGVGTPKIGNQQIAFFEESFSAGSNLSANISFKNTGDVSFRASAANPATVTLYADTNDGSPLQIASWTVDEPVAVGRSVALAMKTPKLLEATLPAGTKFYVQIAENDFYGGGARTASTADEAYTIESKQELELADFAASVREVRGNNVVLDVKFVAKNSGGENSADTFVQFSYKAEGDGANGNRESAAVYKPIDITGNTLSTEGAIPLNSFEAAEAKGVYQLPGGLASGYSREVSGTITVPKAVFNTLSEGNFGLRAELFDGEHAVYGGDGMVIANADEYNVYNNYEALPILPITFFGVASNIAVSLGNAYKLPIEVTSTKFASKITVSEVATDETPAVLNQLYYDTLGFVNVMGGAAGSGIMRVADVLTNEFKDIAFTMTEGTGINIYKTNGIFTFYNKNGSLHSAQGISDWKFMEKIVSWSGKLQIPLNGDLSVANEGSYFEFTSFANEIDLYFDGEITVYSDKYADFLTGENTYKSTNIFAPTTITFSTAERFNSHTVKIVAKTDSTAFDKLVEYYDGDIPIPPAVTDGPTIVWSRSIADPGSIANGETFAISAFLYDVSGVVDVLLNDVPVDDSAIERISNELVRVDFEFDENGIYLLSATNMGGKTSHEPLTLEAFTATPIVDTKASAPPLRIDYVDEYDRDIQTTVNGDIYMQLACDDAAYTVTAEVYYLISNDTSGKGYDESLLTAVAGDNLKYQLPSNGYYRVLLTADDGTWSQSIAYMNYSNSSEPIVVLREETGKTFDDAEEGQRHLFYYASKAETARNISSQAVINEAKLNSTDLGITSSQTIFGYSHISYGGQYTFEAVDDAGNRKSVTFEINDFVVQPKAGFVTQRTGSTLPAGSGALTIDRDKLFGGNYAGGATLSALYGEYVTALVDKSDAFSGEFDSAAATNYFKTLQWSDSSTYENLQGGDYILYLRDKTDEQFARNVTIGALAVTIEDHILSASAAGTATSNRNAADGTVVVSPKSGNALAEYEVALVHRGDNKPAVLLEPFDASVASWKAVTETDDAGKARYTFTGLEAGWYQVFVKTDAMDPTVNAEAIYTALVEVEAGRSSGSGAIVSPAPGGAIGPVSVTETDDALIITYPGDYYDMDSKLGDRATDANASKPVIIVADNVSVYIPAGVLGADNDINNMVADTSGAEGNPYETVYYIDENGEKIIVPFSSTDGGKVEYIAGAYGSYGIMENRKAFSDTQGHWASYYIDFVTARELFNGVSDTEFSPDTAMTRAMFVTVLGRLMGVDTDQYSDVNFADVEEGAWYSPYVEWARQTGIVSGYGNGMFGTDDSITREQLCVMIMNFLKSVGIEPEESDTAVTFADADDISPWAAEAVAFCQRLGIVSGMRNDMFAPKGIATRAQVAVIFTNIINLVLKHATA
ncbi:S-layer homology domain-containing protein [Oscillospiraceae bacterium OttesenSCG-928-G22]|nr:S-layer homology domain-containing protein [Oscillospiraceae bacterium OttesenSCG-928-G22]